ncbi:MAG: ClC family H(+)/Cl(-) exchange transporter [Sarcina sp.]
MLNNRKNLKSKLIIEGAIVGLIAGIVMVANRLLVEFVFSKFQDLYSWARSDYKWVIVMFLILIVGGFIVGKMVKREPMIAGSGIPQVEGILSRNLKMSWIKVLFYKFFGGVIVLGTGLSVGKEGPSVQMGAAIGQGFGKLFKRINIEQKFLITAGASAGLSSAFNAPLSGVIFALEEVHKNFSPIVLISAMTASLSADFVLRQVLHAGLSLDFGVQMQTLPLEYYWTLILLGVIIGVGGAIFSKGIVIAQGLYGKLKVPVELKVIIPFILTGIIALTLPILLGGGHGLIMSLPSDRYTLTMLIVLLVIKFLFTIFCFGSGIPGGIFFPLLVLGGVIGDIFGIIICHAIGLPNIFILNFIILAMAGNFASIVKAPITGMVLIMEMTGSFQHLLALSIVVIVSYTVSDLLKMEPIYETLLDRLLVRIGYKKGEIVSSNKALLESVVEVGSRIEGKLVKDIHLPDCCLLVSIKRGEKEIIPRGYTKIIAGDYLVVMAGESQEAEMFELLEKATIANRYIKDDYEEDNEDK